MGDVAGVIPFQTAADIVRAIPRAVAHVRRSGLLGHPTETVYGIGCALDPMALERLAALKTRGDAKPFVTLIAGEHFLGALGVTLRGDAAALAKRFWPGPLTLVLPSERRLARGVQGERGGVAVRWTSHPGMQELLTALGEPLTSTSANAPGLPPATMAREIVSEWADAVRRADLVVLDGGPVAGDAVPSTIVDCTVSPPRVIRGGVLSLAVLCAAVPGLAGEQ